MDEVPKGYKRTEVGVIPSDWSMHSIGDLFDYLRTASNSRAELGDTGDVAYVHYGDIHTRFHHFIDFSRCQLPRLSVDKGVTANRIREGDLIVADASEDEAGVGKSVEVRNLAVTNAVAGLHTLLLRPKDLRTYEGYRGYLLEQESVKRQLRSLATGLKVFGISKQALRKVRIPLPSPAEQRTIAEALSDVDGLLTALDELLDKKQAVKKATMQQLLTGKFRLPGFSRKWETKRLGEIASIRNQKVLPSKVPIDTPCVELDHIGQRVGRLLGCSTAQYSTSSKYRFYSGDVLFGRLRSYLRKFWLADRDGICTTEIWPLVTDTKQADNGFLYAIIQSDQFIKAASVSYGTHMPRTDWNVTRNFEIWLPPVREQRAIAGTLSDMDIEISVLERHRDKTRAIKQCMMQQLLTGRVRLVKPASPSNRTE